VIYPESVTNVIPLRPDTTPSSKKPRKTRGWSKWPGVVGGRIFTAKDGKTLSFYVDRKIAGVRYPLVNLHAHDASSAIKKLRRWEENPAGYNPAGDTPADAVLLSPELVADYIRWCGRVPPGKIRRRNTDVRWIKRKRNYLGWWAGKLAGRNLRSDGSPGCITTDDLKEILDEAPAYRHRLEAIKHFYTWLQTEAEGRLRVQRHHDPSDAIPIPKPDPAQARKSKVGWSKEDCDVVIAWLEQQKPLRRRDGGRKRFDTQQAAAYLGLTPGTLRAYAERGKIKHEGGGPGVPLVFRRRALNAFDRHRADEANTPRRVALALRVLGGTSWHVSEVIRFGLNGTVEELPPDHARQHGAAVVLRCQHKGGFVTPYAVTEEVAAAAAELKRLGGISHKAIATWVKKAVKETGAAPFTAGQFRHRGSTMQVNQGADLDDVSKGLRHKSTSTTKIYTFLAVPPKQQTWY
jgi:hypothetical protein